MGKEYRSALALEQAVKTAARRSGQDVGRAVEGFYVGRLLERVFSEERKPFVLKGGRGILARTVDARYTTDTDFLYKGDDLGEALGELKRRRYVFKFRLYHRDKLRPCPVRHRLLRLMERQIIHAVRESAALHPSGFIVIVDRQYEIRPVFRDNACTFDVQIKIAAVSLYFIH